MILFGASGHAKVIIDILEKNGTVIDFLVDANSELKELQSYQVVHGDAFVSNSDNEVIVSIGSNRIRKDVVQLLKTGFTWAIHPSVILGDDVSIGPGTVVMAGVVINSSTSIGSHAIVNTSASVDHDCEIMDFTHISPKATLCGNIRIGEGTHVGAGATIIPNIRVGKWTTIGAGAVVISDVPDYAVVVGNPGRIIKYNDSET